MLAIVPNCFLDWAHTLLSFSDPQVINLQRLLFFDVMTENLLFGNVRVHCSVVEQSVVGGYKILKSSKHPF